MSDAGAREWRFYIDDMITFAENVISYTNGFDQERFVAIALCATGSIRPAVAADRNLAADHLGI